VPGAGDRGEKVTVMTQQLARVFETAIAAHPEDWHMLQKVFTADLDPDRLARVPRAGDGAAHEDPSGGPGRLGGHLAR
jgi:hypothetical protein